MPYSDHPSYELPKAEISAFDKTMHFLNEHTNANVEPVSNVSNGMPHLQPYHMQPPQPVYNVQNEGQLLTNCLMKKNLLVESFQQQKFNDTLMTNCVAPDSKAYNVISSIKSSCATDPQMCIDTIWSRLEERFGAPELIKSALKTRLSDINDFTDTKKFDLHDLLNEVQTVKKHS